MLLAEQRQKVIDIALEAQQMGLVMPTFGNISLKDALTGHICITPSGAKYDRLRPEEIAVIDQDGNLVDGARKPSKEVPMHCLVYRARSDISGIVHSHSVFATAWSACGEKIPVVNEELAKHIGGPVECAPYRAAGSRELGEVVTGTLRDRQAVLMANHGVLAVGRDLEEALLNALVVEMGARVAYYARGIGKTATILD